MACDKDITIKAISCQHFNSLADTLQGVSNVFGSKPFSVSAPVSVSFACHVCIYTTASSDIGSIGAFGVGRTSRTNPT